MKTYHHIEYYNEKYYNFPIVAFDKLDGSNIRIEYSHKRGFYKFGTRKTMFNEKSEEFGFVVPLFKKKYEKALTEIFKTKYSKILSFVCYFEVFGTKSEYGQHDFENDTFDIVLIDVDRYKKGFIPPVEFVKNFQEVGIPKVVFEGEFTKEFVTAVQDETDYLLKEGVVCKGVTYTKKGAEQIFHFKIKTKHWLENLKKRYLNLYKLEMKDIETETSYIE